MKRQKHIWRRAMTVVLCLAAAVIGTNPGAWADEVKGSEFAVSPMNQEVVLTPGEVFKGSFVVSNPSSSVQDFSYSLEVVPFYVDDEYSAVFENNGDYNQIVDWITLEHNEGVIAPNSNTVVRFTVNVPDNAPAGGQYASIIVSSKDQNTIEGAVNIQNKLNIAHVVYAEVAGTTVRKGEIVEAKVPGFMFDGKISGNSTIKNTGNVHGTATYKLQVFPLFSNEEIYTNEEKPEQELVLPDRQKFHVTPWEETPSMGIFNVKYTVEFEGVTTEVTKMVIKCPLWLLFVILFVIIAIIIWIVMKSKSRKKAGRK